MTHVLDIGELKKLIPEIKKLEGMDFNGNLKKFLQTLIPAIEKSGDWEFVQYMNASGIFIIRQSYYKQMSNVIPDYNENYKKPKWGSKIEEEKRRINENIKSKTLKEDSKITEVKENSSIDSSKLFTKVNLPWSKNLTKS